LVFLFLLEQEIEAYAHVLPEFLGGSADLASSNLTLWSGSKPIRAHENVGGNYLNYGVREFGMSAIMNGIALHGGFILYGAVSLMPPYAPHCVHIRRTLRRLRRKE